MNLDLLSLAIGRIHTAAQSRAGLAINQVLNRRNWLIGAYIVEFEQGGEDRAEYGGKVLETLATRLKNSGHNGLSLRNLKNFRQLALAYSNLEIRQTLSAVLEAFLLELGRDFCFVERQMRITVAGRHHFLDLLFFHRELRCLVAIDLKIGSFKHENAAQVNFYLNYLKENTAKDGENPPVGILLCADKESEEVHYATAGLDNAVFVSRYLVALPSEEQLKAFLRREQEILSRNHTTGGDA